MRDVLFAAALAVMMGSPVVAADDDIMFAKKNYYETDEYVAVSGTLTGTDLGYPNNTYAVSCFKDIMTCLVSSIEQIGPNHIGRMDNPSRYEITNWTPGEVVATDGGGSCARVTFTISRRSQRVLWVQEPTNQTKTWCAKSDTQIHKWTIEDSLGYRRMNQK